MDEKTASLLFGLSEQNVESIADSIAAEKSNMDESQFVECVSNRIVASAVAPDAPRTLYVQFVLEMQTRIGEKTMKKALLPSVQAEYELIWGRDTMKYVGCDEAESQDQPMILDEHRAHWLGFMEFLGLLYVNGLVAEIVIRSVLDKFSELRGSPDENLVEGICRLLLTDGVVSRFFAKKPGETYITQWKGLKCLTEFFKKKTRYLQLKPVLEATLELVEHKGIVRSKPKAKSAGDAVHSESAGKGRNNRGHSDRGNHVDDPGKDRFAALVERDSPSGGKRDSPSGGNLADFALPPAPGRKGRGNKGRSEKGGEKGDSSQPDPRQIFVAGTSSCSDDEIKSFFQQAGDVDRVKVLRTPEGDSKDVCFITFRTEDQAQKALGLHGASLAGRSLTVRLANGKKGNEKGGKGERGRLDSGGSPHSPQHGYTRTESPDGTPPDIGGSSRFDALAHGLPPPPDRSDEGGGGKGKGKGGKSKGKGEWMSELDSVLEEALQDSDSPVKVTDFDFTARRFLTELRSRDRIDGTTRFQGAIDMVINYTAGRDRSSVRKWSAYIFTLLQKFDPDFSDEFKRRDEERRRDRALDNRRDDDGGHDEH